MEGIGVSASGEGKLVADRVCVEFERNGSMFTALQDVSLEISDGEFVSIVGPSGCGKTTFLMAVDGLCSLTSGRVLVDGKEITGPGPDRAVVFQDAGLLPWRSVLENVTFGLEMRHRTAPGSSRSEARRIKASYTETAKSLIRLVGLEEFESSFPAQLSGGMQQRVNLARALAVNPELLLLDEPFASLDAQTRETMQEELLRIWDTKGTTALLVTHQIDEAVYLSDRVVIFGTRPGRVLKEISVPFPRPRVPELRQEPEFAEVTREIWSLVRTERREEELA